MTRLSRFSSWARLAAGETERWGGGKAVVEGLQETRSIASLDPGAWRLSFRLYFSSRGRTSPAAVHGQARPARWAAARKLPLRLDEAGPGWTRS